MQHGDAGNRSSSQTHQPDVARHLREWPYDSRGRGVMSYQEMPDEALLRGIAESDRAALEALYDRYGRRVFALAARMLNDPQASEEVTQDVFLSVWRRVSSYKPGRGKFTTWLFSIAHNRTIDELRRRMRDGNRRTADIDDHLDIKEDLPMPAEQIVSQSEHLLVRQALKGLPVAQREVVELSYFGGLTQVEIADRTGQPLGTVKTRMRLALKKLREALRDKLAAPDL